MVKLADLKEKDTRELSDEERVRLFTHGTHEEGVFYNRLNFFLLFETVLFAAAVGGLGAPAPIIIIISVLGLCVSVLWWYAQVNKLVLLKTLETRIENRFLEFKETIAFADANRRFMTSANAIFAHVFPWLFAGAWVLLLIWLCCCK